MAGICRMLAIAYRQLYCQLNADTFLSRLPSLIVPENSTFASSEFYIGDYPEVDHQWPKFGINSIEIFSIANDNKWRLILLGQNQLTLSSLKLAHYL